MSDLLRKFERFRHAVVEPSCHGVLRSLARFRALACVGAMFVLFPSSVVSSISVCASGHLIRHFHGSRHSARFISHLVVRTHPDVSFHQYSEHGSGAFVLTCGCCWVMVSMEYATGEKSGYWYCGGVTQTWPLGMRLQEMDPSLLKRSTSTRCNCWNGSAQETREWKTSRTAQVEAVVQGTMTQQASMTQGEVRSGVSLVDTKLVTKQNAFSGEKDGQERWRTWSFMMRPYRAAHVTKLYYILSVLLGDKALDSGRTRPVRDGVTRWRWMVTCWEPRAFFRVQRTLQATLVIKFNIPGTDVTQLLTVWTDQVKDYKNQNSNKTFGECRSSWNPTTHDECDMMATEMQAAAICQVCGERGQSAKDYGYQANWEVRKVRRARKTRKDSGKAQEPRTLTTRRKELATIAKWLVILRRTARGGRRESHTIQATAVKVMCTA